jgi:quinol monooxygenase YgiN
LEESAMLCLTVMILVRDPADVPRVRDLLSQQRRGSLTEPGCLKFDVYHSTVEPRRFVLVEHWASAEALEAHRVAEVADRGRRIAMRPEAGDGAIEGGVGVEAAGPGHSGAIATESGTV